MKKNRTLSVLITATLALSAMLVTSPAWADSKSDAEAAFTSGRAKMKEQKYEEAAKLFQASLSAAPSIGAELNLAAAEKELGRWQQAWEHVDHVISMLPKSDERLPLAQALAKEIDGHLGRIKITLLPAVSDAQISIDGTPASAAQSIALSDKGMRVLPGSHNLRAESGKLGAAQRTVTAPVGQDTNVTLTFPSVDNKANVGGGAAGTKDQNATEGGSSPLKTVGFVGIGVGGAALVAGTIFGVLAIGKANIYTGCQDDRPNCKDPTDANKALKSGETFGAVSTVSFVAGGVLLAGGLVLVLIAPSSAKTVGSKGLAITF
jgi:hypothetical protein